MSFDVTYNPPRKKPTGAVGVLQSAVSLYVPDVKTQFQFVRSPSFIPCPGCEATGHNKKEKKTNSNRCGKIDMFLFSELSLGKVRKYYIFSLRCVHGWKMQRIVVLIDPGNKRREL